MSNYPEIQALQQLHTDHRIHIAVIQDQYLGDKQDHPKVRCILNDRSFELYVDDEYSDLAIGNPLLSLCLVLRELETFQEEEDLLRWSNSKSLNPGSPAVLNYYKKLSKIYAEIEQELGKIDSQISDLDFQLNAGAVQILRTGQYFKR